MNNLPMHVIAILHALEEIAKSKAEIDHQIIFQVKELDEHGRHGTYSITGKVMTDALAKVYTSPNRQQVVVDKANYVLLRRMEIEPERTGDLLKFPIFDFSFMVDGRCISPGSAVIDRNFFYANTLADKFWDIINKPSE